MRRVIIPLFMLLLNQPSALGQWTSDSAVNTLVCSETGNQKSVKSVSDGTGGVYLAWIDERSGNAGIYAQHINDLGETTWAASGAEVCSGPGVQYLNIDRLSTGEIIVIWADNRSGDFNLFAQKLDDSGNTLWTGNGLPVCVAPGYQSTAMIDIDDFNERIILAWTDHRSDTTAIYCQSLSFNGVVQWAENGIPACIEDGDRYLEDMVSDEMGGTYLVWSDTRSGMDGIYMSRITEDGSTTWPTNGVPVCTAADDQLNPQVACTGQYGAVVVWTDYRAGIGYIYAQRMDANGLSVWPSDGVPVCDTNSYQGFPTIVPSTEGRTIISWEDFRGDHSAIFAQCIDSTGLIQWEANGVRLSDSDNGMEYPQSIVDGANGAIVSWMHFVNDDYELHCQRIDESGNILWGNSGSAVTTESCDGTEHSISGDGNGGAILSWPAARISTDADVFTQLICPNGNLGFCNVGISETELYSEGLLYPNPASDLVSIQVKNSPCKGYRLLDALGREVKAEQFPTRSMRFDVEVSHLPSGIYTVMLDTQAGPAVARLVRE